MMKRFFPLLLLSALSLTHGQEEQADATPPVVAQAPAAGQAASLPDLPAGEEKIRAGIVLLAGLHDILAKVQNKESAEAAVAPVMRFSAQLQNWGHSFNALPPLDDETRDLYEHRYLPIIERLNARIQAQADRIASAEFYGSRNLPAALVQLVANFQ